MGQDNLLFAATGPRIFTLPPSAAFLDELAAGLIEATGAREKPETLADALIFMPNRRSQRELALALFNRLGVSLLAPEIRALGDIEEEDGAAAFGPDVLDLPPPLEPAKRRGALARLVQAWRVAQGEDRLPPRSLLAAADELGALIDQSGIVGGVDWSKLDALIPESDVAEHWRKAATFLGIITDAWPKHLIEQRASDTQTRRLAAAEQLAARWATAPPERPVIIAGSTGSGAATRILMQAVLALPHGVVVLPGLDADLDAKGRIAVNDAPSHPQHTLLQTLKWLGLDVSHVRPFPRSEEEPRERARRRLVNEALAPAAETRGWNDRLKALASPGSAEDLVMAGLDGLCLVEAEDESEEALAAALLLRETLETPGRTAALVTPEASLGRRVSAILERWGLDVPPSEGVRLQRTRAASFVLLLIRWALDPAAPVALLSVLKHPCANLGRTEADLHAVVSRLELAALRGPRLDRDLESLAGRLDKLKKPEPAAAHLIRELDAMHAPFLGVFTSETLNGAAAAEGAARLAEAIHAAPGLKGEQVWSGRQGAMASAFLEQLGQLSTAMGPIERDAFPDFAEAIAQQMTAPPETPEHPRIVIWGPLEARLQRRDRMILASLNEGSWPRHAAADAFLNRKLRRELGLPDPDERLGLSAHDFAQMANAPEVILLRARRVADKPAVASRWLWRLRTLAAGGLGNRDLAEEALKPKAGADPLAWARAVRSVAAVTSAKPPRPTPPANRRNLKRFSPSRTVTLIRDPYADFAKESLHLERKRACRRGDRRGDARHGGARSDRDVRGCRPEDAAGKADHRRAGGGGGLARDHRTGEAALAARRTGLSRLVRQARAAGRAPPARTARHHPPRHQGRPDRAESQGRPHRTHEGRQPRHRRLQDRRPEVRQTGAVRHRAATAAGGGDRRAYEVRRHRAGQGVRTHLFPDLDQRRRAEGQERPRTQARRAGRRCRGARS